MHSLAALITLWRETYETLGIAQRGAVHVPMYVQCVTGTNMPRWSLVCARQAAAPGKHRTRNSDNTVTELRS